MFLQDLQLAQFRNIGRAHLELSPGITVFVGVNGQGKTNLLEAIRFAATMTSHRTSSTAALIQDLQHRARIVAQFHAGRRHSEIAVEINDVGGNSVQLNGQPIRRRSLASEFPLVLFSPQDLQLVNGDPAARREFLNELCLQVHPRFADTMSNYERVVRQRNTLLKSLRTLSRLPENDPLLDWDAQLAHWGARLIRARTEVVSRLRSRITQAYAAIADDSHHADSSLEASVPWQQDEPATEQHFRAVLQSLRSRELDRAVTLAGPHRDDLVLQLNGLAARNQASHGESWSYALALRVASAWLLRDESRVGDPVVMLDDVFAELDRGRRERLVVTLADFEQVLITAAVREELPDFGHEVRLVPVRAGRIGVDADV